MADDPYKVLGLSRTASDDELRSAYRKLAKSLHPDLNPNNAAAESRFKQVAMAYSILGDEERRKQFDRGEIDASGEQKFGFQGAHGAGQRYPAGGGSFRDFGVHDIFSDIFGGANAGNAGYGGRTRGQDVRYTLEVDFLEAAQGTKKRVTLPGGNMLDLTVPAGVKPGQVLRLSGKGQAGVGGPAGDALVEIKVRPHPTFERDGDDIVLALPITLDEAVLGAKIEVQTISGRVALTLPKGTSSGQMFRLKGKGILNPTSRRTGDQIVRVRIVMPDVIDAGLEEFLTEWRKTHGYDAGR